MEPVRDLLATELDALLPGDGRVEGLRYAITLVDDWERASAAAAGDAQRDPPLSPADQQVIDEWP